MGISRIRISLSLSGWPLFARKLKKEEKEKGKTIA